jgi:hypothetical protein
MNLLKKNGHQKGDMAMTLEVFPEARVQAAIDEKTCDYCRGAHGKRINDLVKSSDDNFPPFHDDSDPEHPYPCRCILAMESATPSGSESNSLEAMIQGIDKALIERHYSLLEQFLAENDADPARHQLCYYKDAFTYVLADREWLETAESADVLIPLEQAKSLWPHLEIAIP